MRGEPTAGLLCQVMKQLEAEARWLQKESGSADEVSESG